jgi:O-antigen/teichoic acid export membrane protein
MTPGTDPATDLEPWHDFGLGVVGASAALAGLLVVAISINVEPILKGRGLTERAAATLAMLSTPLFVSLVLLAPDLSRAVAGTTLTVIGVLAGVLLAYWHRVRAPQRTRLQWFLSPVLPAVALAVATAVAGVGVLTGAGGGLYWLLPAVAAGFFGGLNQAWVLLIEILR